MLITSRSFAEYEAMFDLSADDLTSGAIDVCAGGSSFVAECAADGLRAIAIDPAYAEPRTNMARAVRAAVTDGHAIIADHRDRFVWDYYGDAEHHRAIREQAAAAFLADLERHPERYIAGVLPTLPLADDTAGLVLCSHLLFTWSSTLDESWHLAALRELVRVAHREVRIFPLVAAGTGDPVPYLDDLMAELESDGVDVRPVHVPYEFQRGGNEMLVLTKRM